MSNSLNTANSVSAAIPVVALAMRVRERISVVDFGAVGDGVADDYAPIQAALDAAEGYELFFPAGTYLVSTQLSGISDVRLVGAGRTVTSLVATADMDALLFFADRSDIEITGLNFDGANHTRSNIRSYASTTAIGLRVHECSFTATRNDPTLQYGGIEVSQDGGRSENIHISACEFHDLGSHGALVAYADHVIFQGNLLRNIGQHGMEAVTCTRVVESDNIVETCGTVGPGGSGLGVGSHTAYWKIANNIVVNCRGDAPITCEFTSNYGSIDSNVIIDSNAQAGINVSYGTFQGNVAPFDAIRDISVTNNIVRNKADAPANAYGINVYSGSVQGSGIVCKNNVFDGFNLGIAAQYLDHCSFDGNHVLNLAGANSVMIYAAWLTFSSITGNKTNSTTGDHTIKLQDYAGNSCTYVTVSDNTTFLSGAGATKALVYVEGSGQVIVRGNVTGGAAHYAMFTGTAIGQIQGNFGSLTSSPWTGPVNVLNAQGNFNGLQDFTVVGGIRFFGAPAAPITGTYLYNDRVVNTNCTVGQPKGWVCTAGGSPGTWVSEGNL